MSYFSRWGWAHSHCTFAVSLPIRLHIYEKNIKINVFQNSFHIKNRNQSTQCCHHKTLHSTPILNIKYFLHDPRFVHFQNPKSVKELLLFPYYMPLFTKIWFTRCMYLHCHPVLGWILLKHYWIELVQNTGCLHACQHVLNTQTSLFISNEFIISKYHICIF